MRVVKLGMIAIAVLAMPLAAKAARPKAFEDALLDNMVGHWTMTGTLVGKPLDHTVDVQWILGHQFLQIHETDKHTPPQYEAMPTIGYDDVTKRYVAHWLDVFGGRYSETLGYGVRTGNEIRFDFQYPDGPFHTVFRWEPDKNDWRWLMSQKNAKGQIRPFADMTLKRS